MTKHELTPELVGQLVATVFPDSSLVGNVVPLRGGLEGSVARLTIRNREQRLWQHLVIKRLTAATRHEAARYKLLGTSGVLPSLLGSLEHEDNTYLFIERVQAVSKWPWNDSKNTRLVLEQLARVHRLGRDTSHAADWDYEQELCASAAATVEVAEQLRGEIPELNLARDLRSLQRVASSITSSRVRLMEITGATLIHGDVHSGNVVLRGEEGNHDAVLLDWGRSRIGSPFEDVSSWLLSLRSWEPAAARDHDSLFRSYLAAAGEATELTPELRHAYWIAASSNALAGALRYQLVVARESKGRKRMNALVQARDALRAIRRADERRL